MKIQNNVKGRTFCNMIHDKRTFKSIIRKFVGFNKEMSHKHAGIKYYNLQVPNYKKSKSKMTDVGS